MQNRQTIIDEFKQRFADELKDRRFMLKEYAVLVFSLLSNHENNSYKLQFEAKSLTSGFNDDLLPDKCKDDSWDLSIGFSKYCKYAFGKGGEIRRWESIDFEEKRLLKLRPEEITDPKAKLPIYIAGYSINEIRFVFMLIFDVDCDKDTKFETQILSITLKPSLTRAVERYHKKSIFEEKYMDAVSKCINQDLFARFKSTLTAITNETNYSDYLFKLYYDFLIENLEIYSGYIWEPQRESLIKLSREFERNQRNLFRVSFYRDHFLHQCNVYILGMAIISIIQSDFKFNLIDSFNQAYKPGNLPQKEEPYKDILEIATSWFLSSMFHDIAYPIESFSEWLDAFMARYVSPGTELDTIVNADLRMDRVIGHYEYSRIGEELADYHRKQLDPDITIIEYTQLNQPNGNIDKACCIRNLMMSEVLRQKDHGILSAIMLLSALQGAWYSNRFLFPAAGAISIHNFMWLDKDHIENPCMDCTEKKCEECTKWNEVINNYFQNGWINSCDQLAETGIQSIRKISFNQNPIAFILILCDLLQDWGRQNTDNSQYLIDHFFNPSKLTDINILDNNTIVFMIEIQRSIPSDENLVVEHRERKMKEIAKVFSRLEFLEDKNIIIKLSTPGHDIVEFSLSNFT